MKNTKSKITFARDYSSYAGCAESEWTVERDDARLGLIVTDYSYPDVSGTSRACTSVVDSYKIEDWTKGEELPTKDFSVKEYGTARKALAAAKNYFRSL